MTQERAWFLSLVIIFIRYCMGSKVTKIAEMTNTGNVKNQGLKPVTNKAYDKKSTS